MGSEGRAIFVVWCLLASAGTVVGLRVTTRPVAGQQPFAFNHRIHVESDLDCLQCHEGLLEPSEPRLPSLEKCAECHNDDPGDNRQKVELARLIGGGRPIEWRPLYRLPDHVFFSHRRHVDGAGLECVSCHANMPRLSEPPATARVLTMEQCIVCHVARLDKASAQRATVDCAACHR